MTPQKVTKSDASKSFRELKNFHDNIVLNFSSDRKNRGSFNGKTDYEIVTDNFLYMIELKLYNDKLSEEQVNYAERIINIESPELIYLVATHENYLDIKSAIARKDTIAIRIKQVESAKIIAQERIRLNNLLTKPK